MQTDAPQYVLPSFTIQPFLRRLDFVITILLLLFLYTVFVANKEILFLPSSNQVAVFLFGVGALVLIGFKRLRLSRSSFGILLLSVATPAACVLTTILVQGRSPLDKSLLSFFFRFVGLALFCLMAAVTDPPFKPRHLKWLNIFFVGIALAMIWKFRDYGDYMGRMSFVEISTSSAYFIAGLALCSLIVFRDAILKRSILEYMLLIMSLAACCFFVFQTKTRGGVLATAFIIAVWLMGQLPRARALLFNKKFMAVVILAITMISLLGVQWENLFYSVIKGSSSLVGREESAVGENESRFVIYDEFITWTMEDPSVLLTGIGYPSTEIGDAAMSGEFFTAPHNLILGALYLGGIAYCLCYLILAVVVCLKTFNLESLLSHLRLPELEMQVVSISATCAILVFFVTALTENFPYLFNSWAIYFPAGILFFLAAVEGRVRNDKAVFERAQAHSEILFSGKTLLKTAENE
ncbi:MAG: O-antigen ligase family protein [bacterium]